MPFCAQCRLELSGDSQICNHHHDGYYNDGWAKTNRIMCDFFHRKKIPQRLSKKERANEFTDTNQDVNPPQNTAT